MLDSKKIPRMIISRSNKETVQWLKEISWRGMTQEKLQGEANSFFGVLKTNRPKKLYIPVIPVGKIQKLRKNAVYIFWGDLFKFEDPIYLLSIYVANSTHVWFFTHVCGKIHILHRVQLCGFHHTGVFNCTYVWK